MTAIKVKLQNHKKTGDFGFLSFMIKEIENLKNSNRIGTAQNYSTTLNSFSEYLKNKDIPISWVTESLIEGYNVYLMRKGIVKNSISFYMRILRAVYNKAVRQHLVIQTQPFQYVYTGIDKTRKRAVDETVISSLFQLDLSGKEYLQLSRDIFLFSYFTRGMAFVDIAYLQKSNIWNGIISYTRRKTGQLLDIKIEPCIQQIIDRYQNKEYPYIFPIIMTKDSLEAYRQYKVGLNNYNRHLKKLSTLLPESVVLTSYVARHSWATSARNHNIPISVISAGLGHSSEETTKIYLAMLENTVIDNANKEVISAVF